MMLINIINDTILVIQIYFVSILLMRLRFKKIMDEMTPPNKITTYIYIYIYVYNYALINKLGYVIIINSKLYPRDTCHMSHVT